MIRKIILVLFFSLFYSSISACSIVYYIDSATGKIYAANNEDYWSNNQKDIKDYMQIIPEKKDEYGRLWSGWDKFAQGGVNSKGLFFDGAVTPEQVIPAGFKNPYGRNIGDELLAHCSTVDEALEYLEKQKIAVSKGHLLFGDATGNAVILEWVDGETKIIKIQDNVLIATNFLESKKEAGGYPCYRYDSIEERVNNLKKDEEPIDFRKFGNVIGGAVQPVRMVGDKEAGTLYSSFVNITDMEFVLVPKLDSSKAISLDLNEEFKTGKKRKIKLTE